MKQNRQKTDAESRAELLDFVLERQNPDLLVNTMNQLGIKGKKANELKARSFEIKAARLEENGKHEDFLHSMSIAKKIRGLGDKEMDFQTAISFLE